MSKTLWINDSGATTEEIAAGIKAAEAVLAQYGVSAEDAEAAQRAIDEGEIVDNKTTLRAVAWGEADRAAVQACCAGWSHIPEAAYLALE